MSELAKSSRRRRRWRGGACARRRRWRCRRGRRLRRRQRRRRRAVFGSKKPGGFGIVATSSRLRVAVAGVRVTRLQRRRADRWSRGRWRLRPAPARRPTGSAAWPTQIVSFHALLALAASIAAMRSISIRWSASTSEANAYISESCAGARAREQLVHHRQRAAVVLDHALRGTGDRTPRPWRRRAAPSAPASACPASSARPACAARAHPALPDRGRRASGASS